MNRLHLSIDFRSLRNVATILFWYWADVDEDPNLPLSREDEGYYFVEAKRVIAALNEFFDQATENDDEQRLQFLLYEVGKKFYGQEQDQLLRFFRAIYTIILQKTSGPRLGQFIFILGLEDFLRRLTFCIDNPLSVLYSR